MARRRPRPLRAALLLLFGALLLYLAAPSVAPAVRLATAGGTPGVFTARTVTCIGHPGHTSCSWTGDFQSQDGRLRRADVSFGGSGRSLRARATVPAVDVGRPGRVYDPRGSRDWIATAALLSTGLLMAVAGATQALRVRRSRRTVTAH